MMFVALVLDGTPGATNADAPEVSKAKEAAAARVLSFIYASLSVRQPIRCQPRSLESPAGSTASRFHDAHLCWASLPADRSRLSKGPTQRAPYCPDRRWLQRWWQQRLRQR